ncbi:unnamed protein product [Lactuca saligna]|uniref:Uncharacterized protein n=1 Tax=Lactuca saligna TaxID=75948 RepID=A0AA36E7Q1_LACSI|nr:unnamed protein product [Lactuca saligna]
MRTISLLNADEIQSLTNNQFNTVVLQPTIRKKNRNEVTHNFIVVEANLTYSFVKEYSYPWSYTCPSKSKSGEGRFRQFSLSLPIPSSPINKEEEVGGFLVRKSSPALSESGLRNLGRGSLTSLRSQSSITIPINPTNSNIISTNNALGVGQASEMAKRDMSGTDERMVQQHPPISSLSSRMMLPQSGVKSTDGDNGNGGEGGGMGTRVFSPSGVPGIQWRPGSSFQTQHEGGQFRGRTETDSNKYNKEATPFLVCLLFLEEQVNDIKDFIDDYVERNQKHLKILLSLVHLTSLSSQSDLEANLFKHYQQDAVKTWS